MPREIPKPRCWTPVSLWSRTNIRSATARAGTSFSILVRLARLYEGSDQGAELEYEGPEGKRTFRGEDEVHVEQDVLGTLISVTIQVNADAGGLDFALALPTVYLDGSKQQEFQTIGTLVHTRGRTINRAGVDRTYEVILLEGIAQHVMLPLAS